MKQWMCVGSWAIRGLGVWNQSTWQCGGHSPINHHQQGVRSSTNQAWQLLLRHSDTTVIALQCLPNTQTQRTFHIVPVLTVLILSKNVHILYNKTPFLRFYFIDKNKLEIGRRVSPCHRDVMLPNSKCCMLTKSTVLWQTFVVKFTKTTVLEYPWGKWYL